MTHVRLLQGGRQTDLKPGDCSPGAQVPDLAIVWASGEVGSDKAVFALNRLSGDGYDVYPDMIWDTGFPEKGSKDAEMAALARTFPPDRLVCLRFEGGGEERLPEITERLLAQIPSSRVREDGAADVEAIAGWFRASQTMRLDIEKLLRFSISAGLPSDAILQKLEAEGALPVSCRADGKKALERFRNALTQAYLAGEGMGGTAEAPRRKPRDMFRHVYVERGLLENPEARAILERLRARNADTQVIEIDHYKDVFNRLHQSPARQREQPSLILAKKQGTLIYPGAPVCQSFGHTRFFYTSSVMNCPYDCSYCYLKGMYPSGNLTVFVNLPDIFRETERLLEEGPLYLCVSYDTDLMALEGLIGYTERWIEFTRSHSALTVEIRTKCASTELLRRVQPCERAILAYTLSPDEVAERFEGRAPGLSFRLQAARVAMEQGHPVRLCFDPILLFPGAEAAYVSLWRKVRDTLDTGKLQDVSVGTFRMAKDYLKRMREQSPGEALIQYPFRQAGGYCSYGQEAGDIVDAFLREVRRDLREEQIFLWEAGE
ncbi:MAG: hypothetical protein IJ083_11470 [Clostridia bacterium]|nr:hypothetical protein [Clostridia bacterium]